MIITHEDLAVMFNAVVYKFMKNNYVISPFTADCSYTNVSAYVDLIKPTDNSHIIRVWIRNGNIYGDNYEFRFIDTVSICVKKYYKDDGYDGNNTVNQTLWFNNGECIYEKVFYQIANRNNHKAYAYSIIDANKYIAISYNRKIARSCHNDITMPYYRKEFQVNQLSNKFVNKVMNRIHNIRGFKCADVSCINKVILARNSFGKLTAAVYYSLNSKSGVLNFK